VSSDRFELLPRSRRDASPAGASFRPDLPLDPRDDAPAVRAAVEAWLRVQLGWAWRPGEAAARLREDPDPHALAGPPPPGLETARRALAACGARLVPLPSAAYPDALRRLADAAPVLAVRGDPDALAATCVAVVGARAATAYGREMARRLGGGLARAGLVVVSGLARGIDAAAHQAALDAGGRTIAFQACGPDLVYPAVHRELAARIARRGSVVSELPPGAPTRKAHFPLRNRLISGVSRAVVVVEARPRSGSLVTARHALDQGLEVLAVPGPVTAPTSEGTNELLTEGAAPARSADDVLRAIGLDPPPPAPPAGDADRDAPRPRPGAEARVLSVLLEAPCTRDELARRLGLGAGALAALLLPLELDGCVAEDRDGRLRAVRGLSSRP